MRNIRTIVAVAATVIMLGAVAHAQGWNQGNANANLGGSWGYTGTGSFNVRNIGTIVNLYNGKTGSGEVVKRDDTTATITNYYATQDNWSWKVGQTAGTSGGSITVTNFYLQVGSRDVTLNGVTNSFGSDITGTVTAKNNELLLNGFGSGIAPTNNANYNVRVDGTLGTLELFGGKVQNNGTISKLIFGNIGSYGASTGETLGKVTTLSFATVEDGYANAFDIGLGADVFKIGNVANYDLSDANLYVSAAGVAFEDGARIDFGFGGKVGEGLDAFAKFAITGNEAWDFLNDMLTAFGQYDAGTFDGIKYAVNFNQSGISVTGAPVPEPATLAVLGLGLAGLGLARRRK